MNKPATEQSMNTTRDDPLIRGLALGLLGFFMLLDLTMIVGHVAWVYLGSAVICGALGTWAAARGWRTPHRMSLFVGIFLWWIVGGLVYLYRYHHATSIVTIMVFIYANQFVSWRLSGWGIRKRLARHAAV